AGRRVCGGHEPKAPRLPAIYPQAVAAFGIPIVTRSAGAPLCRLGHRRYCFANAIRLRNIMGTIDADAHVIETMTTFDYIDPQFRHLKPRIVRQVEGEHALSNEGGIQKEFWIIDGRLQPKEHNVGSNTSDVSREMRDVQSRLDHMDALDIDVQVLYPTVFLRAWTQDPTVEVALCRSYNRWLADIWKQGKRRLRW